MADNAEKPNFSVLLWLPSKCASAKLTHSSDVVPRFPSRLVKHTGNLSCPNRWHHLRDVKQLLLVVYYSHFVPIILLFNDQTASNKITEIWSHMLSQCQTAQWEDESTSCGAAHARVWAELQETLSVKCFPFPAGFRLRNEILVQRQSVQYISVWCNRQPEFVKWWAISDGNLSST